MPTRDARNQRVPGLIRKRKRLGFPTASVLSVAECRQRLAQTPGIAHLVAEVSAWK
jgi:hypothetical protein